MNKLWYPEGKTVNRRDIIPVSNGFGKYICQECNKEYELGKRVSMFCSYTCSHKNGKRINRLKGKLMLKTQKVDNVDPLVVFRKYHWMCAYCNVFTPITLRGNTHNDSPELDHIM